jgi:hypothetical protein
MLRRPSRAWLASFLNWTSLYYIVHVCGVGEWVFVSLLYQGLGGVRVNGRSSAHILGTTTRAFHTTTTTHNTSHRKDEHGVDLALKLPPHADTRQAQSQQHSPSLLTLPPPASRASWMKQHQQPPPWTTTLQDHFSSWRTI